MKFTAATTAIFAATAVSGAAVTRQADFYTVSDFSADCTLGLPTCTYNFTVLASSGATNPVTCEKSVPTNSTLPPVALSACRSPFYSFAIARPAGGSGPLDLTVTTMVAEGQSNSTGTVSLGPGNFTRVASGSGAEAVQVYTGPAAFDVPASVVDV